jgi:p-aminobenzoyl-glutamate transporter AbgT
MTDSAVKNKNWSDKFLSVVERVGNALPHPATLFAIMCLLVPENKSKRSICFRGMDCT